MNKCVFDAMQTKKILDNGFKAIYGFMDNGFKVKLLAFCNLPILMHKIIRIGKLKKHK